MQSHGITLSFHREMADSSRELAGPDVTDAVNFESYPRFIKGGFQDYEGLGIKTSTADSKHVPSLRSRLLGNNVLWSLPQKVVESLELTGTSGNLSKSRQYGGLTAPYVALIDFAMQHPFRHFFPYGLSRAT